MSVREDILSRFSGRGEARPLYLPDLTMWYKWHQSHGTLPAGWEGFSLAQVADAWGAPIWAVARPWQVTTPDIEVTTTESTGERVTTYQAPGGTLTARWSLGPDGDWWQVEFPVKTGDDLAAAREVIDARTYTLDAAGLAELTATVGDRGVVAIEIPMRPYSDILHTLVGWSEGIMLLMGDEGPAILEMVDVLEGKLHALLEQIVQLPGDLVLAPDNLDGQFISPRVFRQHLAESYQRTTAKLHESGKRLVVHVGGPTSRLLPLLAQAGVDGVEGVSGPPQGDATLAEARALAGPDLTLWGGIAQDYVLAMRSQAEFAAAVATVAQEARADGRMLVGVADRVPVDADLGRLRAIARLVA